MTKHEGLVDIHTANIIHRDIKPSNIIFNEESGILQIIDFGSATEYTHHAGGSTESNTRYSQEMQHTSDNGSIEATSLLLSFTPAFASPEQTGKVNKMVDCRSDLYSLGVTLYYLLCGVLPVCNKYKFNKSLF